MNEKLKSACCDSPVTHYVNALYDGGGYSIRYECTYCKKDCMIKVRKPITMNIDKNGKLNILINDYQILNKFEYIKND